MPVEVEREGAGAGGSDVDRQQHLARSGSHRHPRTSWWAETLSFSSVIRAPFRVPGGVVAAGIDGDRPPDAPYARRLVDVPVQSEQRLALGQEVADRRAADRRHLDLAQDLLDLELVVEDRGVVELGVERRDVNVDDRPLGMGQPGLAILSSEAAMSGSSCSR